METKNKMKKKALMGLILGLCLTLEGDSPKMKYQIKHPEEKTISLEEKMDYRILEQKEENLYKIVKKEEIQLEYK